MNKKSFTSDFERRVMNTIKNHELIDENDKALVACSGGKDSTTALYLLNKFGFDAEAITIDQHLGNYSKINLKNIRSFCRDNNIKLHEFSFREEFGYSVCYMLSVLRSKGMVLKSCNICGILRRWLINRKAKELEATKLATGHNLDDEAQTILMNFFHGNLNLLLRSGPKTGVVQHDGFVQRVKPLYFCSESETTKFAKLMKFPVLYEDCPCSVDAHRRSFKKFLDEFEKKNPGTKRRLVRSFLSILPELSVLCNRGKINRCESCGEPCSGNICNACRIIERMLKLSK